MDKINFILPDFMTYGRNEILVNFFRRYPNIFMDNSKIYSFYGTFPNAIFNGGRPCFDDKNSTIFEIKKVKKYYNKNNIRITLTFTNQCLEEKHLNDKYCNQILKIFHDGYNEVLVASPILEKYIREKYPKYKINKSITATIKEGNEVSLNYNLVVIDKKNNRDFKYLESINDKNKIEILCDEVCINDCKYTNQHYREISMLQLGISDIRKDYGICKYTDEFNKYNYIYSRNNESKYYVSKNDITIKYFPLGYRFFKLSGRGLNNIVGYESILEYLVKDKFCEDVATYVYENMINRLGE